MSVENKVPNYKAHIGPMDDGAYDLMIDGRRVGELLRFQDAVRIVKTFAALNDAGAVLANMSAEDMVKTDVEAVERVLKTIRKMGEVKHG